MPSLKKQAVIVDAPEHEPEVKNGSTQALGHGSFRRMGVGRGDDEV